MSPDHDFEEVYGHRIAFSNRGKVLYPAAGFTKGELVDYYAAVAPVLLGHLAGLLLGEHCREGQGDRQRRVADGLE